MRFCPNCNTLVEPIINLSDTGSKRCSLCSAPLSEHRQIKPGTHLSGFVIEREIGRGGMGVVYLARQTNLNRYVAIKVLSDDLASDEKFVAAFFREARAAANLAHPNIVEAYDAGVTKDKIHFFVMELAEGENLDVMIAKDGAVSVESALEIALCVSEALDYAWSRSMLCHGDIKPENIIIKTNGDVKLADLGLAKDFREENPNSDMELMATPAYAPPEVIRGENDRIGMKSDMYSFGATLYHVLTGAPPFPGDDPDVVCAKQLNERQKPLAAFTNFRFPGRLSLLVDKLMEKDPDNRPSSWSQVTEELETIQEVMDAAVNSASVQNQAETSAKKKFSLNNSKKSAKKPIKKASSSNGVLLFLIFFMLIAIATLVGLVFYVSDKENKNNNDTDNVNIPETTISQDNGIKQPTVPPHFNAPETPTITTKRETSSPATVPAKNADITPSVPSVTKTEVPPNVTVKPKTVDSEFDHLIVNTVDIDIPNDTATSKAHSEEPAKQEKPVKQEEPIKHDSAEASTELQTIISSLASKRGNFSDTLDTLDKWLSRYNHSASKEDIVKARELQLLLEDVTVPLYVILRDNQTILSGRALFPDVEKYSTYRFTDADENEIRFYQLQGTARQQRKISWKVIDFNEKKSLVVNQLIFSSAFMKLSAESQTILFIKAVVVYGENIDRVKKRYIQLSSLPDKDLDELSKRLETFGFLK